MTVKSVWLNRFCWKGFDYKMPSSRSTFYFDKCCFCINLKTGCFILGYLGLASIILTTVMVAIGLDSEIPASKSDKDHEVAPILIAVASVIFIFLILLIAFNIALLIGLHKDKPGHVKAYLIFYTIFLIIYAILLVVLIIAGYATALSIVSKIIQILISIYFLLVIRSYYLVMKCSLNQHV